ncbi:hypothetical protein TrLO_g5801 [Triparma laevis f. longispina]|uniref:NAD-dependent epimerase/dehydratase domain-containing protein n=1 Tax=Triparma laevis f. longispina TaxID=1714387 RepID=A0A9W6ZSD1_9STRA|nr:hypothetical protein TrLO_g5801 [Triparma laevis f. longispina]
MLSLRIAARAPSRRCFSSIISRPTKDDTYGEVQEFGGRNSVASDDLTVCVFGASGFLGKYLCSDLGQVGVKGYMPNRGCEMEMRHLKPFFDLGRSWLPFYSPRDKDSIRNVIADADIVVNLIGKNYETKVLNSAPSFPYLSYDVNYSFEEAHVTVPQMIAECCTELGTSGLIHVSSVAAEEDGDSEWARSKWRGEQAVKSAFKDPVIVRSSQMFGPEDKLLNWYAIAASSLPFVPLIDSGTGSAGDALTKPVYMGDVSDALFKIIMKYEKFEGCTFEVEGSEDFSHRELCEFVYDITGQSPRVLDVPKEAMVMAGKGLGMLPNPMITEDMVHLWSEDYVSKLTKDAEGGDVLGFGNLDIEPTKIEKIAFSYLHRFRAGGHFIMSEGYHLGAANESGTGRLAKKD